MIYMKQKQTEQTCNITNNTKYQTNMKKSLIFLNEKQKNICLKKTPFFGPQISLRMRNESLGPPLEGLKISLRMRNELL